MKLLLLSSICLSLFSCNNSDIDWVYVEGGSFLQGENQILVSPKGDSIIGFTSPQREVKLSDFYISKCEITVKQFKDFCEQTGREMPVYIDKDAYGEQKNIDWKDDAPMFATWTEADEFARWAGGRLPTEAEWEYAAKGGNKSKAYVYSGSDDAREVGWVGENADSTYHPVGLLKANELGIHDMTGNVSEWVWDWYNPNMDHQRSEENPTGPIKGQHNMKISKGLSWYYNSTNEKTGLPLKNGIHMPEIRYQSPVETRNDGFGFRIAKYKE